jgi:RNA polymerase sigma-70 factor (ECF subfamily)
MKVFTRLPLHNPGSSFKSWLRKIMVNASIDHYRKFSKHYSNEEAGETMIQIPGGQGDAIADLSHRELIAMIQGLPPSYRTVFNLYVIDGFSHDEIADQLKISVGTSKSHLFKAREHLKALFSKYKMKRYA